jgi:hypothetical protein
MINPYIANDYFNPANPSIPSTYEHTFSEFETLGKLITYVNALYAEYIKVQSDDETLTNSYNSLIQQVETLQNMVTNFGNSIPDGSVSLSKLASDIINQLETFCIDIIHNYASFVCFGINDNGYFVATIPQSWSDINFDTDTDGNLILQY